MQNTQNTVTQLLLLHQSRIFRECLSIALSESDNLDATELDHTNAESLMLIERKSPDVIVISANLTRPLAIELIRDSLQCAPSAKVVVLATVNAQGAALECIIAGAHGCVLEDSTLGELRFAIEKVTNGEKYCTPHLAHVMIAEMGKVFHGASRRNSNDRLVLTHRELEVLRLIGDGFSNKQIARKLSLSIHTVKNHVHNILDKMDVASRLEAVSQAYERHWLNTPYYGESGRELHSV